MPEHSSITDPEIHEPKGVAAATSGQVYVANGSGSGVWTTQSAYGSIYADDGDSATVGTIGTTAKKFDPFTSDDLNANVTVSADASSITATLAGNYEIDFTASVATTTMVDTGTYIFRVRVDDVETHLAAKLFLSGANDDSIVSMKGVLTLASQEAVTVWVESDEAGNTDNLDVFAASLAIRKVI